MSDIRHFIDGQDLGSPRNWQELEITIDWLQKKESGDVNLTELSFVGKANEYLQERIIDGLSGGVGIFEGSEYRIVIGDVQNPVYEFKGFLDFTTGLTRLGGEEITVGLKKELGEDWLVEVAEGFSFAYLQDQGIITEGDFKRVPYVINFIPDGLHLIFLSMSIYMMTKEIIENVQKVAESIADITDASTPVVGVSAGLGAGIVTAWDIGNYILAALKIVARIIYTIAIAIAIINMIDEIFKQLLPKKRFHLGMTFDRMMQRACEYLGMTFKSDLLQVNEKEVVYVPIKDKKGGSKGESGVPTSNEELYTFAGLIRVLKSKYNADYRIRNGVFRFERRDFFEQKAEYKMPSNFNNQERLLDSITYNTDEIVANYNINYSYDTQDQNTLTEQEGRVFQAITTPVAKKNEKYVMIKGLVEVNLPFSMGIDKTELNAVEEVLKVLGGIVDEITGIFGRGTRFRSAVENRKGSLLLSSDQTSIGKVVLMQGSKLASDQRLKMSAKRLWESYHFINSFAEYQGRHNQFFIFSEQPVEMTMQDFSLLLENNKAKDIEGREFIIDKVVYNPYSGRALIDYRVNEKYTNNLKIELL